MLADQRCAALVLKLTTPAYEYLIEDQDTVECGQLLREVAGVPHAVLVNNDLYFGTRDGSYSHDIEYPTEDLRNAVNSLLDSSLIEVTTYATNAELTALAVNFIGCVETGLVWRLYVPGGQLWASETKVFVQLFQDYLNRVAGLDIRLDTVSTGMGDVYELRGSLDASEEFSDAFAGFRTFIESCTLDPAEAEKLLGSLQVSPALIPEIVERYSKDVRRLNLDMRHELEKRVLRIKQRLESELSEILPTSQYAAVAESVASAVLSQVSCDGSPLKLMDRIPSVSSSSLSITVNSQVIERVEGVVTQEMLGDFNFHQSDRRLMQLFRDYGEEESKELASALRELKDPKARKEGRALASSRIKKFLNDVGTKVASTEVTELFGYVKDLFTA